MKLKKGMYVRTKDGKIDKVLEINTEDFDEPAVRLASFPIGMYQGMFEYSKASHNIIDLIEVGDYVNGEKVTSIIPPDILGDEELDYAHISSLNGEPLYEDIEIKSIVTKEQFESISYEVSK